MARVRLNETRDVAESHRWLFERIEKQPGGVLNIYRALSHSPQALHQFMRLGSTLLTQGKLDPALRELAILRAGFLCHAPYEVSQHISFARRAGLTDAQIRGCAAPNTALFNPQQMAVLTYAGELTSDAKVSDATHAAVAEFFNDEQIVELALVTGFYNLVSRALNALQVDIDPPAQRDYDALIAES